MKKKIIISVSILLIIGLSAFGVYKFYFVPNSEYKTAVQLYSEKKYDEAIAIFNSLNNFKDSREYSDKCLEGKYEEKYNEAVQLLNNNKCDEAKKIFSSLGDFKDSKQKIKECVPLEFKEKTIELYTGDTYKFKEIDFSNAKWSSSNEDIATVSKDGEITAKNFGEVTITASVGERKAKCKLLISHEILKYLSGYWFSVGHHGEEGTSAAERFVFTNNSIVHYSGDGGYSGEGGEYRVDGEYSVKYIKTDYGYFIDTTSPEAISYGITQSGYELVLYGENKSVDFLQCVWIENGEKNYSMTDSLEKGSDEDIKWDKS